MCLAIPAKVIELKSDGQAVVDITGVQKEISLRLIEDPKVGDYVIVHMGFALNKLDEEEAQKTLATIDEAIEKVNESL
jgi:hydrogenase expression/formation protein HypC